MAGKYKGKGATNSKMRKLLLRLTATRDGPPVRKEGGADLCPPEN